MSINSQLQQQQKAIPITSVTAAAQVYSILHGNVNVTKLQSVMPCLAFFIILTFEFQEEFKALPNTWPYFHGFMPYQLQHFNKTTCYFPFLKTLNEKRTLHFKATR